MALQDRRARLPREVALAGGFLGLGLAWWCFRDAYERRGRKRPPLVTWVGI